MSAPAELRACPADETWARIAERGPARAGVTRLGELTRFEELGLRAVWRSVRPLARGFSIACGHGPDAVSARVAALGAALERAAAERSDREVRLASAREIAAAGDPLVEAELWPTRLGSTYSPERPVAWVRARELLGGPDPWVPFERVHARMDLPSIPGEGAFLPHPTGLAAGNTTEEAILHGLLEVIERDAEIQHAHAPAAEWDARRRSISPSESEAVARITRAAEPLRVWDVRRDIDVPVLRVMIGGGPSFVGTAARPDPRAALEAALGEALAARAEHHSGGPWSPIRRRTRVISAERAALFLQLERAPAELPLGAPPEALGPGVGGALAWVLARVRAAGHRRALWAPLSGPDDPLAVIRALIPGLEPPRESADYVPGPRIPR